jgi:phospholipid transport system substrate-binding protein
VALASASAESSTAGPIASVDQLHGSFLDVMKRADELGHEGRSRVLDPVIQEVFDLEFMALRVLGSGYSKLSPEDRARWTQCFGKYMLFNFARRFDGWSGQSFASDSKEPAPRDTVIVRARLVRPKEDDIRLDYRLRETSQGWQIVDIYSNGTVSELALRRSEFASIFRRDGLARLIEVVEAKATN